MDENTRQTTLPETLAPIPVTINPMNPHPFINEKVVEKARPKYSEKLVVIAKDNICPFCVENIKKYHTNQIVEESLWMVTENLFPYTEGKHHILFIPKRHITTVQEIYLDEWVQLFGLVNKYLNEKEIINGGFFMKFGNTSTVKHLHFHIVQDTRISKSVS